MHSILQDDRQLNGENKSAGVGPEGQIQSQVGHFFFNLVHWYSLIQLISILDENMSLCPKSPHIFKFLAAFSGHGGGEHLAPGFSPSWIKHGSCGSGHLAALLCFGYCFGTPGLFFLVALLICHQVPVFSWRGLLLSKFHCSQAKAPSAPKSQCLTADIVSRTATARVQLLPVARVRDTPLYYWVPGSHEPTFVLLH